MLDNESLSDILDFDAVDSLAEALESDVSDPEELELLLEDDSHSTTTVSPTYVPSRFGGGEHSF